MSRATTKTDLLDGAIQNFNKLNGIIASMIEKQLQTDFDFSLDEKKEEHWTRDKNLRDIYIHLYEMSSSGKSTNRQQWKKPRHSLKHHIKIY